MYWPREAQCAQLTPPPGARVLKVRCKMGISEATFYNWKKKYGGLGVTELRRLDQLESIQGVR